MSLEQTKMLERYRQKFGNESFRKMSARTGIQISRLFRIFNGQEMRISEYLTFQEVLCDASEFNPSINADEQFWNWVKTYWSSISLNRKIHLQNLIQSYVDELTDYMDQPKNLEILESNVQSQNLSKGAK